jgi:hypothetical protein
VCGEAFRMGDRGPSEVTIRRHRPLIAHYLDRLV